MSREHYIVEVKRKGRRLFLLWFTNHHDGLVTDDASRLRIFSVADEARAYAAANALVLGDSEVTSYDLDEIETWIIASEDKKVHSDNILNAWNLFTDLSRSVGNQLATARLLDRGTSFAYEHLVSTSDLPALGSRPAASQLSEEDRRATAAALRHGLACFDDAIDASERNAALEQDRAAARGEET